ncbi:MAG: S41 family peptidase [Patescibacteria group bacterium]
MKGSLSKSLLVTLIIIGVVGSFGLGIGTGKRLEHKAALAVDRVEAQNQAAVRGQAGNLDMQPFWKTFDVLNEKFVATTASSSVPTDREKVFAAIEGLTSSYGDPYTSFFPPKEAKQFEDEVRGDFGGIGAEIGLRDEILTVVAPLKGTPAERAGLKSGDVILKIDAKFTAGLSVEDAVSLIRGPKGTQVVLMVKQNGDAKEVAITRDTINIPTIDTKLREDGVFVISLYSFSANSPTLFRGALREFILSGSDKLVLDLRNNPGGYLNAAIDMASWFLPLGKVVVVEDGGVKAQQKINRSQGYNVFTENLKMVILINGGSASASEILAGALNEHNIAKLVGEKSFGKGSVQELVEITPDTSLKVTIARWLTPNGHSISENGLVPEIKVETTKEDIKNKYDRQMEKAAEILKDPNFKP